MNRLGLKLYINGGSPASERAVANLRAICETLFGDDYQLLIADVSEHPDLAQEKGLLATPALVKEDSSPSERMVGDLSDTQAVLLWIGIGHSALSGQHSAFCRRR